MRQVSVLILTYNEADNLPICLSSVVGSNDVVILDSCSTDGTRDIAVQHGARVYVHPFINWADQYNYALGSIPFKNPWVLMLDADELCPEPLWQEIEILLRGSPDFDAYAIPYRNMFWGSWIKHSSSYPIWIPRLFRAGRPIYEDREVNPTIRIPAGRLQNQFVHHSFRKGLEHWIAKHNSYSTQEALETLKHLRSGTADWRGLFDADPIRRRRALKNLSFRLPFRPILKFVYMYFFRRGFLDGLPGLRYCTLQAVYEYMIVLKVAESEWRSQGKTI